MKSGCSFGRLAIPSNTSRYSVKIGGRAEPGEGPYWGRGLAGGGV